MVTGQANITHLAGVIWLGDGGQRNAAHSTRATRDIRRIFL